ncbi:hypothetical protein TNCV_1984891 [Trichonephila clavipes]|nr:hypothetical protein TNCV_1984891 [Trichonephila clavipes]
MVLREEENIHANMNATLLQQHLRSATGSTISTQSVRNRLHGVGLYARRPMANVFSDMNPLEHVGDALKRLRVNGCQIPHKLLKELERALLEEWDRIPQLVIS